MQYSWKLLATAVLAGLLLALPGCGKGTGDSLTVQGHVTLDGKPLESGIITFLPADGKGASGGAEIVAGRYETQLAPGEKKVSILAERVTGTEWRDPGDPNSETFEVKRQYLPTRYNSATTLRATISASNPMVDFPLTSK